MSVGCEEDLWCRLSLAGPPEFEVVPTGGDVRSDEPPPDVPRLRGCCSENDCPTKVVVVGVEAAAV